MAMATGISVAITKHYKLPNVRTFDDLPVGCEPKVSLLFRFKIVGWGLILIGMGTMSMIKWNSSMAAAIG